MSILMPPANALYVITRLPLRRQIQDTERIRWYSITLLILIVILVSLVQSKSAVFIGGLAGGVAGILGHWHATAKAVTRLDSNRISIVELQNILERAHYVVGNEPNRSFPPKFPKWLTFRSQTLQVETEPGQWVIYGPYAALKVLLNRIKKWLEM